MQLGFTTDPISPLSGLLHNDMASIIIYCGELAHSKDGLKAQKVYSPEQRSGHKLTNYLAL